MTRAVGTSDGSGREDSDAIDRLVRALNRTTQLSRPQEQAILQFRLIRNGLGNFGRHDDPDVVLLKLSQSHIKEDQSRLTFDGAAPKHTARLTLKYRKPHQHYGSDDEFDVETVPFGGRPIVCDRRRIALVEAGDAYGEVLGVGIPTQIPLTDPTQTAS
jgi:hypothetical protein